MTVDGRRELVVNADDFGWSRSVNLGIVEAHVTGIVTRASILATGVAFEDAAELALAQPSLGMGVHLNFYRGNTILEPERVSSLTGSDGRLLGSWREIARRLVAGRFDLAQLEDELRAQVRRVKAAGLRPAHLDSEKHLHLWPSVFDVVCRVAVESGITQVRVVREPPSVSPVSIGLGVLSVRDAAAARSRGLVTPASTIGVTHPPSDMDALARILRSARGDRVEFVVHPGHVDEEFMDLQATVANRLVCSREEELAVLTDPGAFAAVENAGFTLASETGRADGQ
jgi:predicted glycoside hydrolase/deacetylase ChbG (UPF0249 family)